MEGSTDQSNSEDIKTEQTSTNSSAVEARADAAEDPDQDSDEGSAEEGTDELLENSWRFNNGERVYSYEGVLTDEVDPYGVAPLGSGK